MCYVATHPEKMDATKEAQWRKLAKLSEDDMAAINNLEFLGVAVRKRGTSGLAFGRRRKRANRKVRVFYSTALPVGHSIPLAYVADVSRQRLAPF